MSENIFRLHTLASMLNKGKINARVEEDAATGAVAAGGTAVDGVNPQL